MTRSRGHFEGFQNHTLLKHAILRAYFTAWAMKLIGWGGAGRSLVFVDAFAGQGKDATGNAGSPLIACRAASTVRAHFTKLGEDAHVHVIAIEKDPDRFSELERNLKEFGDDGLQITTLLHGELVDNIDEIEEAIGPAPTLYFLDPFGISGLDASTYARMLKGAHNEVFVLFDHVGAVRLHGLVRSECGDVHGQLDEISSNPSLFSEDDEARFAATIEKIEKRDKQILKSREPSREHLTRALGADWAERVERAPKERRMDAFISVFIQQLVRAGARRVVALPMRNELGRRVYTLVHASKSPAGYVAMKEAISSGLRSGDTLPKEVCEKIRADLALNIERYVDAMAKRFAGLEMAWTGMKGEDSKGTLKRILLEDTILFPFQLEDVKKEFKRRGYQQPGRKIVYRFPAAGAVPVVVKSAP